jgi:predicted lactoylglutathione lyase
MTTSNPATATYFEGVCPILPVANVQKSIDHYLEKLGFKLDWQATGFASVNRDKCHIMLCEGEQGHPGTWVWIGVGDVELLFEEYRASGAKIRHPPTNYEWAYEMQVEDLDGNVLRMGSEPKPDQPIGPRLDMNGVLWEPLEGGGWTKTKKV